MVTEKHQTPPQTLPSSHGAQSEQEDTLLSAGVSPAWGLAYPLPPHRVETSTTQPPQAWWHRKCFTLHPGDLAPRPQWVQWVQQPPQVAVWASNILQVRRQATCPRVEERNSGPTGPPGPWHWGGTTTPPLPLAASSHLQEEHRPRSFCPTWGIRCEGRGPNRLSSGTFPTWQLGPIFRP